MAENLSRQNMQGKSGFVGNATPCCMVCCFVVVVLIKINGTMVMRLQHFRDSPSMVPKWGGRVV